MHHMQPCNALNQAWVRSPKNWSRSKIKIITNDLDQNLKRSKITAIDLDHCKIKDQDQWSWSLNFELHLFSKRSNVKINIFKKYYLWPNGKSSWHKNVNQFIKFWRKSNKNHYFWRKNRCSTHITDLLLWFLIFFQ